MKKTIVIYSLAIAAAAFGLQWLEYQLITLLAAAVLRSSRFMPATA